MKISTMDRDGTFKEWCDDPNGTHVPLPLDASAVPDAVVKRLLDAFEEITFTRMPDGLDPRHPERGHGFDRVVIRGLIAALAAALGEVG
jgi:hypothetical protein